MKDKLVLAARVLMEDGPLAFGKAVLRRAIHPFMPYSPDEAAIISTILHDMLGTGRMMDVGAHHGSSFAFLANRGWDILAVEPDTTTRHKLETAYRNFSNVRILPCALSDKPGTGMLYKVSGLGGCSSLTPFSPQHSEGEVARISTARRELSKLKMRYVDFLKVDAEGYDFQVLRGFPWERILPRVVMCEFSPPGYGCGQMAAYLCSKGYAVIVSEWEPVTGYGWQYLHRPWLRFAEFPCSPVDPLGWGNIIAIHRSDKTLLNAIYQKTLLK